MQRRMTRKKTHKRKLSMPGAAKKLVVVQNNEPAAEAAPVLASRPEELRLLEALLFAAGEPLDEGMLARRLPNGVNVKNALAQLRDEYASRGVNLVKVGKNGPSAPPPICRGCLQNRSSRHASFLVPQSRRSRSLPII